MRPPKAILDSLSEQATRLLNSESSISRQEIEQQLKALLQSAFNKLDLVSREEFEGQKLVLARTRAHLEALEAQVRTLEQVLQKMP